MRSVTLAAEVSLRFLSADFTAFLTPHPPNAGFDAPRCCYCCYCIMALGVDDFDVDVGVGLQPLWGLAVVGFMLVGEGVF